MNSKRMAQWGNWGITFCTEHHSEPCAGNPYGVRYEIHGRIYFPVGNQGPMDGFLGSPQREGYKAMCRAWMNDGVLPQDMVPASAS